MLKGKSILLVLLCTLATTAFAQEIPPGVYVVPSIGLTSFDNDREIDDAPHLSLGLGYRFDSPWAVELDYTRADSETSSGSRNVDVDYLAVNGLYHFATESKVKPFLLFGLGEVSSDTSGGSSDDESFIDIGGGIHYPLSANSALRTDLRIFRETSGDNNVDVALNVGYLYSFGKASAPAAVVAKAPVDGDDDNDGVLNSMDQCPDTPPGAQVDANGCPVDGDEDQDGVSDSRDQCPGTPKGVRVDADGCPDADGDGVVDQLDKCPGTPAGVEVDSDGCGPDADMDGIPNHRDECAQTFPPALVDEEGCYVILEEIVRITLDVEFDFDKASSRPEHVAEVKKVADFMAKYPLTQVTLEGHTDNRGADAYNQGLSERRAATIGKLLIDQFDVDADRVSTVGYGEAQPIDSNDSAAGRQRNRRVVAEISAIDSVKKRVPAN